MRLFDWEPVTPEENAFTDVTPERWFYSAVETALANEAIAAAESTFRPTEDVTREEMASMLIRALGYTSLAGVAAGYSAPFSDVNTNRGFIVVAHDLGIVGGVGDDLFASNGTATREQAAAMLVRVHDLLTAQSTLLEEAGEYRTVTVETPAPEEGAELPSTVIRTNKNLVNLKKRGRMLVSSYEALRFQKLDLFTVTLRQIGAYIAGAQIKDAVDVLVNGDGSKGGVEFTKGGKPDYADFIALWAQLAPYQLNTVLAGTAAMQKLLNVAEFKDAQAGMNFQGTGRLCTPLGAKLIHVPGMAEDKILVLDKNCALEMIQSGEVRTDVDRLIDRQLERAAISVICGFARIFEDAAVGLDCSAGA